MTDWQRTLNLLPEWERAQDNEISPQQMAGVISKRLLDLEPFSGDDFGIDHERVVMAEAFEDLSTGTEAGAEEFDALMSDLYDWADTRLDDGVGLFGAKMACWVRTF